MQRGCSCACGVRASPSQGHAGAGVVCRRPATAEQSRARRLSAGALCPGCRSGLQAKKTSLKGRGGLGGAHRGVMWPESRRRGGRQRGPSGGARTESVTGSVQGLSGLLDGTARPQAVLREGYGGQGSPAARKSGGGGAYRQRRAAAWRSCAVATARVRAAPAEWDGGAGVRLGLRRAGPGIAAG